MAALSWLRRTVKVSEARRAMLSFTAVPSQLWGAGLTVASVDGKTMRGVWEDGWRLRPWYVFSREGALALDRMRICGHQEESRAAQEWMDQVSGSVFVPERGRGCGVLTGDRL